jgi:hypothetical protein
VAKPVLDSWEMAKEIFFPLFYTRDSAIAELNQGRRIGCAITPNVGVYTSEKSNKILISYKKHTVGFVDEEAPVLLEKYRPLFQVIGHDLGTSQVMERNAIGQHIRRSL